MSIAKQLYQLQEIEIEIDASEQALKQSESQLGENRVVLDVRTRLVQERQRLEELTKQQRSAEWSVDDIGNKQTTAEGELYSGKIKNPKELSNLQQEVEGLKAKRSGLEDKTLEIMEQVELVTASVAAISRELEAVEAEWQRQQRHLSVEIKQLKTVLVELDHRRQLRLADIDASAVKVYNGLKEQKGQAVAKVEQGICRGCRILLATAELQRARSGNLMRCGSCGRILFLA